MTPYCAIALQLTAQSVEQAADTVAARSQIMAQIAALEPKIRSARIFVEQYGGSAVKLVVLPEYLFTSYPGRISIPDFAARAFENAAYVVSANTAGITGSALPLMSADGNSQIVGPTGKLLAQSGSGETFTAFAEIDIAHLRQQRRQPAMVNSLARQRPDLFAPAYAAAAESFQTGNQMLSHGQPQVPDRDQFLKMQRDVIEKLSKAGVI